MIEGAPHWGDPIRSGSKAAGAPPPSQPAWRRFLAALLGVLGFVLAAVAFPLRAADRVLPLRGIAVAVAMFWIGSALFRHTQLRPPLEDAPYVVGAVLGFMLWLPLVWLVTSFRPKQATLADNLGLVMLVSFVGLPWLGAGLIGGANLLLDRGPRLESAATLLEVLPQAPGAAAGKRQIRLQRAGRTERPLLLEADVSLLPSLEPGTAVRLVTGAGFFGWEYRIAVLPAGG